MSIVLAGGKLKAGLLNGKNLKEVWLNGHKIWPENTELPRIMIHMEKNSSGWVAKADQVVPEEVTVSAVWYLFEGNAQSMREFSFGIGAGSDTSDVGNNAVELSGNPYIKSVSVNGGTETVIPPITTEKAEYTWGSSLAGGGGSGSLEEGEVGGVIPLE